MNYVLKTTLMRKTAIKSKSVKVKAAPNRSESKAKDLPEPILPLKILFSLLKKTNNTDR